MTKVPPGEGSRVEFELVVRCAHTHPTADDEARIRHLLDGEVDWGLVLRLANYHGVRPLLHHTLARVGGGAVPATVREELARHAHATAAFNAFLAQEVVRLTGRFEAEGLPVLALKGPVVARMAYGDLGLRPFVDLDLLIRPADFERAERLLEAEAYTPFQQVAQRTGLRKQVYLRLTGQSQFNRHGIFNLDLHTHIMPPLYYYAATFAELRARAVPVAFAGGEVYGLQAEDLLLMLCFHGEKNRWETLKYVCDVAQLVRTHPALDWEEALARTRRTRGLRILLLGLSLARHYFAVPLPPEIVAGIERDEAVRRLTGRFAARHPRQVELGVTPLGERMRIHMSLQNTLPTKARYLFFALVRRLLNFEI